MLTRTKNLPATIPVEKPELETDEARQGVTGHNVRYVLGVSLAAVIIVMIIVAVSMLNA